MLNRAGRDDDDEPLFVKDGVPVKFCFHQSVTQGRSHIRRDVERNGGQIVADERATNVLLVDEQEDLAFIRRRYYSSTELYRLSIYVEPRGFVQACIRAREYRHIMPVRRGMPGRAPGGGGRVQVPFTEEDKDHLAYYLATRCPMRDGRMGLSAYKDLVRLGQTDDPSWEWARRHTFQSWREHYRRRAELMDLRIDHYIQQLKDVGHHFGHDPRSRDHRNFRHALAEESEEGSEEEEEWRGIPLQERSAGPAPRRPDQAAGDYLARHEQDLVRLDSEEEDQDQVIIIEPPHVKRYRLHPDVHRQRDARGTQAKKARVADAPPIERRTSGVEARRAERSPAREGDTDMEGSEEFEGSDLFGDRTYEEESRFDWDDQGEFPMPLSARASPVPGRDVPPPSTQATLIASPRVEKQLAPVPDVRPTVIAAAPPPPTIPSSTQQTLVVAEERVVVPRARVRGASAQPGPSVPRERTRGGAPYRDARARSHSVEPQAEAEIEEDVLIEEAQSEATVEGLLEARAIIEADEDDGSSIGDTSQLPSYQEVEIKNEPSESDDAETHGSLVRGAVESGSKLEQDEDEDEDEDEDDAARIERMANGRLHPARARTPPQPRITRSQTRARTEKNRSFPSPKTKARAVVDRIQEEEQSKPYRATRAVKGKGRG